MIYRPCLSYAGKKNFVNTQIVLEMMVKDEKDYIRSIDFVGQKWTDALNDLGGTIFVDKNRAKQKLSYMIAEKERNLFDQSVQYQELGKQEKLVLFPSYAYCIIGNEVRKGFVLEVTYCICRKPLYVVRYDDNSLDKHTGYLGLSVFLTEKEAEEKLKELNT